MGRSVGFENDDDLNLKATELRLGLPGSEEPQKSQAITTSSSISPILRSNKRASPENSEEYSRSTSINTTSSCVSNATTVPADETAPPAKAQIVGWPPIRSYRKNCLQVEKRNEGDGAGMFVKVSVDGAPYLRKIDLKGYKSYADLLKALQNMFRLKIGEYSEREGYNGSDYSPTYEDKDGDWMLVGDVPWEMFISTCKRLRIMRGSEARGMAFL